MKLNMSKILIISMVILGIVISVISYINKPADISMFATFEASDTLPYDSSYTYVLFHPNGNGDEKDNIDSSIIAVYNKNGDIIDGTKLDTTYNNIIMDEQLILWETQDINNKLCFSLEDKVFVKDECNNVDVNTYSNTSGVTYGGYSVTKQYNINGEFKYYYKEFNEDNIFIYDDVTYYPVDFMYLEGGGDNEQ